MKTYLKLFESSAITFLVLPFFLLLISGLLWIGGGEINGLVVPLGSFLALACGNYLVYGNQVYIKPILLFAFFTIFIGFLCLFFHDPAFDSNWYHQPGIYLLSHGWNPIYQHHSIHLVDDTANMWIDHYAKGQETICATIVAFTGNMEVGKLGNFFLPISSFMFVILALHKFFKEWSTKKLWGISFIIAFPPIVWNQLFSYYIDFNLYSIVVTAFFSFVLYQENTIKFLLVFVSLLVMALSVKFNMCLWFGLLYIGFMIVFWVNGNRKMVLRIAGVGIVGVMVSVLTFSFNPYITNTIDHHSPVYPLMGGQNNVDIMSIVEPASFKGYNRVEKILVADFSRPTTGSQSQVYQFPYGGYPLKNLTACGSVDAKLGGAGLFWIDALVMAIFLFFFLKTYKTREGRRMMGLCLVFFATQFLVPGGWFYRYVSYIYLIPLLLVLASEIKMQRPMAARCRNVVYGLLFINSIVAAGATLATTVVANQIEDYYVKCINRSDKPCFSSTLFGFVRKIEPKKRNLNVKVASKEMEPIPLLPTRVRILIDYKALNRDVPTTFVQKALLKKGVLK